ncbi:hypothetical protein BG015_003840, partial [Linnemannia schmuckeri]
MHGRTEGLDQLGVLSESLGTDPVVCWNAPDVVDAESGVGGDDAADANGEDGTCYAQLLVGRSKSMGGTEEQGRGDVDVARVDEGE